MSAVSLDTDKNKFSRIFSSLFCSISILTLGALCLLNNMSVDLYSASVLLKVVVPGGLSFWVIGYIMGFVFDNSGKVSAKKKAVEDDTKAYEIPSIFSVPQDDMELSGVMGIEGAENMENIGNMENMMSGAEPEFDTVEGL